MSELINRINQYGQDEEAKKIQAQHDKEALIASLIQQVYDLAPRISVLVDEGNACLANNIPLVGDSYGGHEGYDTHQFFTNWWSHLTGFWSNGDAKHIAGVGVAGGGACNYNLFINKDGSINTLEGNVEHVLRRFVDEFDEFEHEFHAYIESVIDK